jgi:hypothetical protein
MRSRIVPWDLLTALAQLCGIPRFTRFAVIITLASIEEPTATVAIEKVLCSDLPQRDDVAGVPGHRVGHDL